MSVQVLPYDVTYVDKVLDEDTGVQNLNIHLWCLDRESKPWLIRVTDFPTFCYVELPSVIQGVPFNWTQTEANRVVDYLKKVMGENAPVNYVFNRFQKLYYYQGDKKYPMLFLQFRTMEALNHCKNLLGKPRKIADFENLYLNVYEANIDPIRKLFTVTDCNFCSWLNVSGEEIPYDSEFRISTPGTEAKPIREMKISYKNMKQIRSKESESWFTFPRIVAFDIETYTDNHKAMPESLNTKHVCNIISCIYYEIGNIQSRKKYVFVLGDSDPVEGAEVICVDTEVEMIEAFCKLIIDLDPEIISGYNIFAYDYPYLDNRLKTKLKDWMPMGRIMNKKTEMSSKKWKSGAYGYNEINILQMDGRISIDMLPIVKRDYKLDKYSLDFVSKTFIGREKHDVKPVDMFLAYEHQVYVYSKIRQFLLENTGKSYVNRQLIPELRKYVNECRTSTDSSTDIDTCNQANELMKQCQVFEKRWELARQDITRIVAYCLPADQHQILTNKGYLFLHEVEALWGPDIDGPPADPTLLFAGYNPVTQEIVYERPKKLIINSEREQELVEFTQQAYRSRWNDDNIFGLTEHNIASIKGEKIKPVKDVSNFVSILTTPDHNMYARCGKYIGKSEKLKFFTGKSSSDPSKNTYQKIPFKKIKAGELLKEPGIQLLSKAIGGVSVQDRSQLICIFNNLGLNTKEKQTAFLELYGYYVGDGSLHFSHGNPWIVTFQPVKPQDIEWLYERFLILGLEWNHIIPSNPKIGEPGVLSTNTQHKIIINDSRYVKLFFDEYGDTYLSSNNFKLTVDGSKEFSDMARAYAESLKSGINLTIEKDKTIRPTTPIKAAKIGKWFMTWVWQLNKDEARSVLSGLRMADGSEAHNRNLIHTSSATFRDEIERLALHAGYAAYSTVDYLAGTVRNKSKNGKQIIAQHTSWKVQYPEDPQFSEPTLKTADGDIKSVKYTGRTWCVTMPSTFIVARRAEAVSGFITRASKPVIIHNCIQDSDLVVDLFDKLNVWLGLNALSSVVGVTIIELFTRGQQVRCLSQVYDKCYRKGIVLDKRVKDKVFYNGGFVFEPKSGLYDGVICLDFASLYPSIMRAYNICFTTLVAPDLMETIEDDKCATIEVEQEEPLEGAAAMKSFGDPDAPDFITNDEDDADEKEKKTVTRIYKYKWVNKNTRYGVLPEIQDHLVGSRNVIKKELAALEDELEECTDPKRLAEIKLLLVLKDKYSNALKVSANSLYGFLGAQEGGVLSLIEAAMCITSKGRNLIMQVNTYVETKYGGTIVYGDSVTGDTPVLVKIDLGTHTKQKWFTFTELYENFNTLELNRDYKSEEKDRLYPTNVKVWSDKGWTNIKQIIRHKTTKNIWNIRTKLGWIKCTEDHSLLRPDGQEVRPEDVKVGALLLHRQLPYPDAFGMPIKINDLMESYDVTTARKWQHVNFGDKLKESEIIEMTCLGPCNDYVYDLETENHHFSAGVGFMVVHNTDSSMVDLHLPTMKEAYAAGLKLAEEISGTPEKKLPDGTIIPAKPGLFPPPLKIEFEKLMRMLSIKKKKYAALLIDKNGEYVRDKNKDGSLGELKILKRGIIVARRDTAKIVHKTYNKLLHMILTGSKVHEGFNLLMETLENLVNDRISVRENLCVIRSLGDSYKSDSYFMKVFADELVRVGRPANASDRLEYVIVRTKAEEAGAKDMKLGLKMRLIDMYEDSMGIRKNDNAQVRCEKISDDLILCEADPLRKTEDSVAIYPPEKIDYEYYIGHVMQMALDQLFSIGYMKQLEAVKEVGYTPQFRRLKPAPLKEPIAMIVKMLDDYKGGGYGIDQSKVLISQVKEYYGKVLKDL